MINHNSKEKFKENQNQSYDSEKEYSLTKKLLLITGVIIGTGALVYTVHQYCPIINY